MIKIIDYKENTGEYNMNFDADMLDTAIKTNRKEAVIRIYGWLPSCVSLGRNQKINNINTEYLKRNKIDIVRRITGGRALFHDDEITYSFVCPVSKLDKGESVINSYKEISYALIEGLKQLNIELSYGTKRAVNLSNEYCMMISTGADLCYRGKKLIGSAQARKRNYILQHGSILYSYNKEILENIFSEELTQSEITSISEINKSISKKDITESIKKSFKKLF